MKTLSNTDANETKKNVSDVQFFGNGDLFQLLSKASSDSEGWMKSTKAMETGNGCVVQVTTQQRNPDGSYSIAEALTFVPNTCIDVNDNGHKELKYVPRGLRNRSSLQRGYRPVSEDDKD